jgi:two-component system sensor histidine kinase PilS (NtrC family)
MFPINVLIPRLRILIISRIFIAAFFLFYAQRVFPIEELIFYSVIVATVFLSAFYVIWLSVGRGLQILVWLQIVCDLILESVVVYYTGGADSLFATIYILSILSAGLIVSPAASFYVASGSAVSFLLAVFLEPVEWIPFLKTSLVTRRDPVYLFYASYVRITVFFLVAILTYFFSQKIRKLEDQMKTQERLVFLGEVVSTIAHEIRNPLASISGSVELIQKQLGSKLNEKQGKMMGAVVDESERVKNIFSGLLDYSRLSEPHLEEVKLKAFLDEILLLAPHQHSFNPKVKVETVYRRKNSDTVLRIDPEQMKQVFMNLIANAHEAMPHGGSLKISAHSAHGHTSIIFEDNGTGMDRKTLSSLFLPFKTTKPNGTGLGLSQAYKIVGQHGGSLTIQSKKGKGTKAEVTLPRI